jgi:hypothetical protein
MLNMVNVVAITSRLKGALLTLIGKGTSPEMIPLNAMPANPNPIHLSCWRICAVATHR